VKQNKQINLQSLLDIRPRRTIDFITDIIYVHIENPLWIEFELRLEYMIGDMVDAQVKRDFKVLKRSK